MALLLSSQKPGTRLAVSVMPYNCYFHSRQIVRPDPGQATREDTALWELCCTGVPFPFPSIKGAYDNVPQDSHQLASVRLGVLQPIRSYLRSLYQQSRTRLLYGGQIVTDENAAGGVKQGAPSNCALFNAVMDLVTKSIRVTWALRLPKV